MAKALAGTLRGRQPRRELAEDQARAHARSGGAGRRMGPRPPQRQALEPAPGRARTRRRATTSCSARPSRASPMRCSSGRRASFWRARCGATPWTVYVRPELVVEIAFSDLQASSRYPGGVALRLARVKRYRTDKRPAEADDMDSVRRLFAAQTGAATDPPAGSVGARLARLLRRGTFAPRRRASESPIAIACLRLVTFLPERPLRSLPCLRSFIARSTLAPAALPYLCHADLPRLSVGQRASPWRAGSLIGRPPKRA